MKALLKKVKIIDVYSKYHGKHVDILIINSRIEEIKSSITPPAGIKTIQSSNLHCSPAWIDIGTQVGEPGLEHRETIASISKAAKIGGYGTLASFPNTQPVVQSKPSLQYLIDKGKEFKIKIQPIAALSDNTDGKDINEMMDLHHHGAVAFGDGLKSIQHTGVLARALEYVRQINGLIIHHPSDGYLTSEGQLHEGDVSTLLGMKGRPALAEHIMLKRDLDLLQYTESKLCVHTISSAESVRLIKEAKKDKLNVFSTVPYLNLIKTDKDLLNFDSNLKVIPPLRKKNDQTELIKGLKDDSIDAIVSNHYPIEEEGKKLEFPFAKFGASGLETCFSALNTYATNLDLETLVYKLSYGPAKILGIDIEPIAQGSAARLTLFDPDLEWSFDHTNSKSKNNPFLGQKLKGKVIDVMS